MASNEYLDDKDMKEEFEIVVDRKSIRVVADAEMAKKLLNGDPGVLSSIIARAQGSSCIKKPVLQTKLPDWPILPTSRPKEAGQGGSVIPVFNQVWTKSAEKLVLEIYRKMESEPPMKNKWDYASKEMEKQRYKFSGEQCRLKIKSLKERYMKLKKKLEQSGSDNPTVPDDLSSDLEETFSSQPDVHPVCTLDSEEREEKKDKEEDQKRLKGIEISSEPEDEDMAKTKPKRKSDEKTEKKKCKKPKCKGTNRPSTADICKIIEQNGIDAERRHNERLELQNN